MPQRLSNDLPVNFDDDERDGRPDAHAMSSPTIDRYSFGGHDQRIRRRLPRDTASRALIYEISIAIAFR